MNLAIYGSVVLITFGLIDLVYGLYKNVDIMPIAPWWTFVSLGIFFLLVVFSRLKKSNK